jgi:hypothetical protein
MRAGLRVVVAVVAAAIGLALVVPVVLVAIPLWLVSGCVRMALLLQPKALPWRDLTQFDWEVGWQPRSNLDCSGKFVSGAFRLSTCAEGWRGQTTLEESQMVIFGDSYAFGFGIDERHYFASVVTGVRVKAIGMNGYNMVQALLWMRRMAPRLRGKLVVWWVFSGNDLYENLTPNYERWRMPFVREHDGSWEIVTGHVNREPWISTRRREYAHRLAEICSDTPLSRRAFSACEYLLSEGKECCAAAGADLAVMTLPAPTQVLPEKVDWMRSLVPQDPSFDPARPDRVVSEICHRIGLPFTALSGHLESSDFLRHDSHWNSRGHKKVADLLGGLYAVRRTGLLSRGVSELQPVGVVTERAEATRLGQ